MKQKLLQPVSKRQSAVVVAIIAGAVLLGWGGWTLYGRLTGRPQSPPQMKKSIHKHISKHVRGKGLEVPPEIAAVTFPEAVVTTNKAGRVRTGSSGRNSVNLPDTTASLYFRTNQAIAATYDVMYRFIGQQLKAADGALADTDESRRLAGLVLASEASVYARTNVQNLWLSARICQAYLWPQLDLLAATNRFGVTAEAVLDLCEASFKEANETNHVMANYELLIARSERPQSQDVARFRLALLCMERGENARALKLLKSLKTLKTSKITREIARLETLVPESQK